MIFNEDLRLFMESFFYGVSYLGVKEIPFGKQSYQNGMKNLGEMLEKDYPVDYEKIKTAFTPSTISGDYGMISAMIYSLTSHKRLTIQDPFSGKITLKINPANSTAQPDKLYLDSARAFCTGSGVSFEDKLV